jgi:hypothetical protein
MQQSPGRVHDCRNVGDRLHYAGLVVGVHDGNEKTILAGGQCRHQIPQRRHIHDPAGCHRNVLNLVRSKSAA